jgi:hypothetical protein
MPNLSDKVDRIFISRQGYENREGPFDLPLTIINQTLRPLREILFDKMARCRSF